METERKDKIEENHNLENERYFLKTKNYEGIDHDETSKTNRMLSNLAVFIFSESRE